MLLKLDEEIRKLIFLRVLLIRLCFTPYRQYFSPITAVKSTRECRECSDFAKHTTMPNKIIKRAGYMPFLIFILQESSTKLICISSDHHSNKDYNLSVKGSDRGF